MNLSPLPIQRAWDNNGLPLARGLLFTYTAGTTTKVATYTDSTGGTPNTNPISLNARGEAQVWIDPTKAYKFVLAPFGDTDPPTSPIWTVDQIESALTYSLLIATLTQAFIGSILYPRTAAEIAALVTPINFAKLPSPMKDISRFVSDNTGATDVTSQMNDALKAEKNIIIPEGVYKITGSLIFQDDTNIEGSGYLNTIIKGDLASKSFFRSTYGETPAIGQRPIGIRIAKLGLYPLTAATITGGSVGINFRNTQYSTVEDVLMQYQDIGIVTDQIAQFLRFERVHAQIHNTAFWSNVTTGGNNAISDCSLGGNVVALDLDGGAWDVSKTDCSATSAGTTYCIRLGRPAGQNTVFHGDKLYVEGINAATITLQIENAVSQGRISLHRHSTLGTIVNNAGDAVIIEVPGQGYYTPVYKAQRVEFSATVDGAAQSSLRSNGGNTLEARNAANTGYAGFFASNLAAGAVAAGTAGFTTIGGTTAGTIGAAGGASALPATPLGYIIAYVGTTQVKIPYYNP